MDRRPLAPHCQGEEEAVAPRELTPELTALVAERFRALAEPARLEILQALRHRERTVTQLVEATGLGQANASKHLQLLFALGFIDRRKDGQFVYYRLADEDVFRLCEIMCGRLELEADRRRAVLRGDEGS
jgi:DNA-binding transcriptional ArsR family regulator